MVVTRFAPSPTGDLHLGSVRTALFAWLYARHHGGKCLLRIEDTDTQRSTQESVDVILQGLSWVGLDFDGEIVYQTSRTERYRGVVQQLLDADQAYVCECSSERLDTLREGQLANKEKPKYDRCCINKGLSWEKGKVVRFKQPTEGKQTIKDSVFGDITVQNSELDDLIIARADGGFTYNLCVVIDDWDFGVTHVIRGDDHINNTPRQMNILAALNGPIPTYAHLPMILGADGKRLSKRHGAVSILQFRDQGYLPQAMLNMLVRLGWASQDQELFSVEQMIELFDFGGVHKAPAALDPKKLTWLNQQYLKRLPVEDICAALEPLFQAEGISLSDGPALSTVVEIQRDRAKTLLEMQEKSRCFYLYSGLDPEAAAQHLTAQAAPLLESVREALKSCQWTKEALKACIKGVCEQFGVGFGKVGQPLRVAVTGSTNSPGIDDTLYLLGQEVTLVRLKTALEWIEKNAVSS